MAVRWRRVASLLGAVTVVLSGAACTGTDEPAPPPRPALDVRLTTTVQPGPGAVRIGYTLVNDSGEEIVVFSGVPARDTHDNPVAEPDTVYVTARDDGTVEIAKRLFAPPEGVDPAVEFVLRGAALATGQQATGTVRVPLPLRARRPYDSRASLPADPRRAVFCLGVLRRADAPPVPVTSGDPDGRAAYPHRASLAAAQQLVCGSPFDLS